MISRAGPALGFAMAFAAACGMADHARAQSAPVEQQPQSGPPAAAVWLGGDFKNRVGAGYLGGIYAMNGNLDTDGFLFRGQFTYAGWDFTTGNGGRRSGHGNFYDVNGSVGYQWVSPDWIVSGFAGLDIQNYDISPPSALSGRVGDRVGLLLTGRLANRDNSPLAFSLDGQYSTANNQYWTRLGVGIRLGQFTIGPELGVHGNDGYGEFRAGGFARYQITPAAALQGDVGYAESLRNSNTFNGKSGPYGGVSLVLLF